MVATIALGAGILGGAWWLWRGSRQARRLYRRWRYLNSITVYGYREPGQAAAVDAALAALLAIMAGPFLRADLDAARCRRAVLMCLLIGWLAAGSPPLDGVWR